MQTTAAPVSVCPSITKHKRLVCLSDFLRYYVQEVFSERLSGKRDFRENRLCNSKRDFSENRFFDSVVFCENRFCDSKHVCRKNRFCDSTCDFRENRFCDSVGFVKIGL